jgi:hypothetical protein
MSTNALNDDKGFNAQKKPQVIDPYLSLPRLNSLGVPDLP